MAYISLYHFTIFCIVNCYSQSTISRPPVELFLLNQNLQVFQVDIKEFIHVGNGGIRVGCGTTIPQGSNTHVKITIYDGTHMKTNSGTNILFWTRNKPPLNLSCKITFTSDNIQFSSVMLNDVVIRSIQREDFKPKCFPRPNTIFLEDEIVAVLCVSNLGSQWKDASETLLLETDQELMFAGNDEVFSNYILSSTSGFQSIACANGTNTINNCTVEGVKTVNALSMSISPTTFSNTSNFSCNSNVPTEFISWHVQLGSDVMVEVGPGSDLPWSYVIKHFKTSSSFAFPEGAHGLKSVSCSTSRAGHFVMVTAKNATNSSNPTEPNVVCDNDCSSKNASNKDASCKDASKSVAPFITAIVILVIICIILAVVTGFLAYKQARPDHHQKTDVQSDVGRRSSTMNGGRAESAVTDMNVYTGVGDAAKSLPDSDGHLSTDMLDYGAVVTTNSLYQAS